MYKIQLTFATPIKVKVLGKSAEKMLTDIDATFSSPYMPNEVINTVTLEHSTVIPNKETLEKMAWVINNTLIECMQSVNDINVEVAGPTVFKGFTDIEEE